MRNIVKNPILIVFVFIIPFCATSTCYSQDVREDEIFELYKPNFRDDESPIVLDFGSSNLVKLPFENSTAGGDSKSIEDLKRSKIDITIEDLEDDNLATFEELTSDGFLALKKGHYEAADVLYRKALKLDPENNDVFFAIGYANQMMGNNDIAKSFYKKVLKNDKYYIKAFENFFTILAQEDPSYTIKKLKEMAQDNPYHPVILAQLGATYYAVNSLQLALKHYLRAVRIDPENPYYNHNIGIIYEKLKDYETAIQYYEETLQYMNDYEDVDLNREEIVDHILYLSRYSW